MSFTSTEKRITVTEGRYFDYLDTSEVLLYESGVIAREQALKGFCREPIARN